MWEATGPQGETAFLFGTIHALPDGAEWRTPALIEAISESDRLFVEIANLGDRDSAQTEFQSRAYSFGLPPILDRVAESDRASLAMALDLANIDPDSMIHTENWAAALQLSNTRRCANSENGVDRALLKDISDVTGFESYADQFAMFDRLPQDAQTDLLMSVASESGCAAGNDRVAAWLTGDLDTLGASIEDGFRGNAALSSQLIDARNRNYAAEIVTQHGNNPQQTFFIAVGAGHMIGEVGVPALLTEQGYNMRRIQ